MEMISTLQKNPFLKKQLKTLDKGSITNLDTMISQLTSRFKPAQEDPSFKDL